MLSLAKKTVSYCKIFKEIVRGKAHFYESVGLQKGSILDM